MEIINTTETQNNETYKITFPVMNKNISHTVINESLLETEGQHQTTGIMESPPLYNDSHRIEQHTLIMDAHNGSKAEDEINIVENDEIKSKTTENADIHTNTYKILQDNGFISFNNMTKESVNSFLGDFNVTNSTEGPLTVSTPLFDINIRSKEGTMQEKEMHIGINSSSNLDGNEGNEMFSKENIKFISENTTRSNTDESSRLNITDKHMYPASTYSHSQQNSSANEYVSTMKIEEVTANTHLIDKQLFDSNILANSANNLSHINMGNTHNGNSEDMPSELNGAATFPFTPVPDFFRTPYPLTAHTSSEHSNAKTNSFLEGLDIGATNYGTETAESGVGERINNKMENAVKPITNSSAESLPVTFSKCAAGHFQCTNGTSKEGAYCVSLSAKCDSVNDCSDGSDEIGCIEEGCPGNFQCSSGQCLKRHLVCNGIVDCNDGSDEKECEKWQCKFDEFQCPSGRCIPVLWQCDGKPDCDNHTDEFNCQTSCGNHEYLCPENWCIPMTWRCNGVAECANGEDEKLCDCTVEQFQCSTGGCVAMTQVCDGVEDCPDNSDEWDCIHIRNDTMTLEIRSSDNKWHPVCADNWTSNWSDLACQNLGYAKAAFTENRPSLDRIVSSNTSYYALVGKETGTKLTTALQPMGDAATCSSNSILEISCQEFTCGSHGQAEGIAARLVGGDGATNGQWPSIALLFHAKLRSSCTATIISPKWLISSHNCIHMRNKDMKPDNWAAFAGGSMFDNEKPETQIREVLSIVSHPQVKYNQFLYNNDIALIELSKPLMFTRYVGAACLPAKEIEPRQLCVTAGWGYTSPGVNNITQYLHYLPVPTIDLKECNSTKHYAGLITENEICAGFTDAEKSPCYNDEGAPLMCISEEGVWELQGVLSYHSNCGRGYHPSIYSSVTAARGWVEKTVGSRFEQKSTFNVR